MPVCALARNDSKSEDMYGESTVHLPREDLSQVTDAKLYNAIPPFATGLPHLYYSLTTLQNNHILPQHDKNNSRLRDGGGCYLIY